MSATLQVNRLQKSLYDKAYADALSHASIHSQRMQAYARKFDASLPDRFRASDLAHIVGKLKQRNVLLFGDFHTLKQTQSACLRVLEAYRRAHRGRPIILALEMFRASDQANLDAFSRGDITEQELLILTEYESRWGFPWRHYRPLVEFAAQNGIRLVGMNTENAGRDDLGKRDRFTADILLREMAARPDALVACLVGEIHLADQHLPLALKECALTRRAPLRILRVVTNVDRYFFVRPEHRFATPAEYLQLKEDFYCVLNTSPWIKWQSYVMWEEMRQFQAGEPDDAWVDGEDESYTEDAFDLDYQLASMVKDTAQFLGLPLRKSEYAGFSAHLYPDDPMMEHIRRKAALTHRQADAMAARLSQDGFYYEPAARTILVADASLTNLAQAAGLYLGHLFHATDIPARDAEWRFLLRVHAAACSTVASLVLNPKRGLSGISHWAQAAKSARGKRLTGLARRTRDAARAVLAYDAWIRGKAKSGRYARPPLSFCRGDEALNYACSNGLGVLMGRSLYQRVVAEGLGPERLRQLFTMAASERAEFIPGLYAFYAGQT